ncbi:hypothetical protein M885DRAFT_518685 [Pelagophyceae sp. CCMP2097]|nr:hypothetical protein M885DRAFT_518685 [Pelagophyceae sp. CCMP2097]
MKKGDGSSPSGAPADAGAARAAVVAAPEGPRERQPKYKVRTIPFLRQLKKMIEEEPLVIKWDRGNIIIPDPKELEKTLPVYYKHNNYASFQRQLNNFGYHRKFAHFVVNNSGQLDTVYHKLGTPISTNIDDLLKLRPVLERTSDKKREEEARQQQVHQRLVRAQQHHQYAAQKAAAERGGVSEGGYAPHLSHLSHMADAVGAQQAGDDFPRYARPPPRFDGATGSPGDAHARSLQPQPQIGAPFAFPDGHRAEGGGEAPAWPRNVTIQGVPADAFGSPRAEWTDAPDAKRRRTFSYDEAAATNHNSHAAANHAAQSHNGLKHNDEEEVVAPQKPKGSSGNGTDVVAAVGALLGLASS